MRSALILTTFICCCVLTACDDVAVEESSGDDSTDLTKLSDDELWDFLIKKDSKDDHSEGFWKDYDDFKKPFGGDGGDSFEASSLSPSVSRSSRPSSVTTTKRSGEPSTRLQTFTTSLIRTTKFRTTDSSTTTTSQPSSRLFTTVQPVLTTGTTRFSTSTGIIREIPSSTITHKSSPSTQTTATVQRTTTRQASSTSRPSSTSLRSITSTLPTGTTQSSSTNTTSTLPTRTTRTSSMTSRPTTSTVPNERTRSFSTTSRPTTATVPSGTTRTFSTPQTTRSRASSTKKAATSTARTTRVSASKPKSTTTRPTTVEKTTQTATTKPYTKRKISSIFQWRKTTQLTTTKGRPSVTIKLPVKSTTQLPKSTAARHGFFLLKNRLFTLPPESLTTKYTGPSTVRTTTTPKPVTLDQTLVRIDNRKKMGKAPYHNGDYYDPFHQPPICFTFTNNSNPLQTWTECFVPPPNFLFVPLVDGPSRLGGVVVPAHHRKFPIPAEEDATNPIQEVPRVMLAPQFHSRETAAVKSPGGLGRGGVWSTLSPRRKFDIFDTAGNYEPVATAGIEGRRRSSLDRGGRAKRGVVRSDEADDEDAPGVSLAFVFDTTGSMGTELESVKDNAVLIMNEMLTNPDSAIYNFIFVPIHDDETPPPPTVTRNRLIMSEAINRISVSGGHDCPEKSLSGLMKAVDLSRDGSYIYVFTDAEPKDYVLMAPILNLNSKKHHRISFLLTGNCHGGVTPEQQDTFSTIAFASSGLYVPNLSDSSGEIDSVLVWIRKTLKKDKVVLTSINSPGSAKPYKVDFPVDPFTKELTITTTGGGTNVKVKDPTGKVPGPGEIYQLLNLSSISSWNVPSPKPGVWTLDVSNKKKHSVLVSAQSTTDFIYGFSLIPTAYISETSKVPKISATNYVLIQAKDTSNLYNVTEIVLLHINGTELWHQPVSDVVANEGIYRTDGFVPPNERFKMMIIGYTNDGYEIRRITISSVAPRLPDAPYIKLRKEMHATAGVPFNLTCAIDSLVPVTVRIYKEGSPRVVQQHFQQSTEAAYHIAKLQKSDEGKYVCTAQNIAGMTTEQTFLIVSVPPPVTSVTSQLVGLPGDRQVIVCRVKSLTDFQVSWTKALKSSDNLNYYSIGDELRGRLTPEGSELVISPLSLADEGWYKCTARNDGGEDSSTTLLVVREKPVLQADDDQYFQLGDTIILQCQAVEGIPSPDVSWYRQGRELQTTGNIEIFKRQGFARLKLTKTSQRDEGRYDCIGQNLVGKDKKETNLKYSEPPLIGATEDRLEVIKGSTVVLECTVSGVPLPEIKWTKKKFNGVEDIDVFSERTDGILRMENVSIEDSGQYKCSAINVAGESDAVISVLVGSSPIITTPPQDTAAQIDTATKLVCTADGVPKPNIVWRRKDRRGSGRYTRDREVLEIENVTISDAGVYICYAQNIFGRTHAEAQITVTGTIQPKIYKTPGEGVEIVKTLTGAPVELSCPVTEGNPPPQVSWYKNKKLIDFAYFKGFSAENGSLVISAVTLRHVGNYTCQAASPVGVDRKEIQLKIHNPPVVDFTVSSNVVVIHGQNATLPCKVTGDPEPTVTWRRDGPHSSEAPFRGVQQSETNFLFIDSVKTEDSGRYVCFASNVAGVTRREFTLQVLVPPKITKWPEITHTELGNIVSLYCNASGEPRPTVTWFKDNQIYQRARYIQGPYLRFFAESTDAGVYSCLAENKAGSDRVSTLIIVLERPKVRELAKVIEVVKGETALLLCNASGNPDPTVTWLHSGEVVMKTVVRNETTVLSLENVSEKDAGHYYCVATNSVGTDRRKVELSVLEPPEINTNYDLVKVAPGELAQLSCEVTANPRPLIIWHKDGQPFRDTFGSSDDGLLQFIATSNHTGDYTCTATNKAGTDTRTFHVIVLESPKFAPDLPKSVDLIVGQSVDLPCVAFGDPKPDITWDQFNFPILPNNVQFFPENGSLRITNASLFDEGVYTCNAKNKAGLSKHLTTLNVLEHPRARMNVKHPKNGVANEGDEVALICNVNGKPVPSISWWKNGERYTAARSDNFNVLRFIANKGDSGNYTCTAKNFVGESSDTRSILVMSAPKIYQSDTVSMVALRGQTVTMDCRAEGVPQPFTTWYNRGMKINPSSYFELSEEKLTIKNVTVDLSGAYLCSSVNTVGSDEKTYNLSVHVIPEILDEFSTNVTIFEGEDFSLPCKAVGIPPPEIQWKIGSQILPLKYSTDNLFVYHDGTLILSNVKAGAAGEYECTASNTEGTVSKFYNVAVTVSPKLEDLVRGSKLVEVHEGGVAQLKCPAEKEATVIWLKDGKPIKSLALERADDAHYYEKDGGRVLKINDASENDIASYTCLVQDPKGNLTTDFVVNVLIKPYFVDFIPPTEYEVVEGDPLEVDCSAKGNPPPMVKWKFHDSYFGQVPITHHTIPGVLLSADNNKLTAPSASYNNTGNYSCIAVNRVGRSSSHGFTVRVVGPPKLRGQLSEVVTVAVNKTIRLHCDVYAVPRPKFSWEFRATEKDERSVPDIILDDFVVTSATLTDAGEYTCRATNNLGVAEQTFNVNVIDVPTIQKPSVLLQLTDYVELSCVVHDSPSVDASWVKNGFPIVRSPHVQTSFSAHLENGTVQHFLRISYPTKDDSGHYSCIFTNIAGSAEDSFDVVIAVPPKAVTSNSEPIEFDQELGRTLTVICPILSGTDSVVTWYRRTGGGDDDVVIYRSVVPFEEEPSMTVPEVTFANDGEYACRVQNGAGNLTARFKINVLVPPRILSNASSKVQVVSLNSNLTIECPVYGHPDPAVLWTKDFEPITDENITITNSSRRLEIKRVMTNQSGMYSCFARNRGGLAEKHFEVVVLDEGQISKPIENTIVFVDKGETLELTCPLKERENKTSWFKANKKLQASNLLLASTSWAQSTWDLFIKTDATVDDGGVYYCKVDRYGKSAVHQFNVTIMVKRFWGPWNEWSACSESCGTGVRNRTRQCLSSDDVGGVVEHYANDFVQFDDSRCTGVGEDFSICNVHLCPIDGAWSEWTPWEPCNAVCGQGVRRRHRNCDSPSPAHGGRDCVGASEETSPCQAQPCPVHGNWSEWSDWDRCSTTCGFGVRLRTRRCDNPPPQQDGFPCEGSSREITKCDSQPCPNTRGKWSKWSEWSECSKTCGKGFKRRARTCLTGSCQGINTQLKSCKLQACVFPPRRRRIPRSAELTINGEINGVRFNDEKYLAFIDTNGGRRTGGTAVRMNSPNSAVTTHEDGWFPYQEFILPAVTWTTAREIENAKNGYSMSQGEFRLHADYEFSTGQSLSIESDGLGTNDSRVLKIAVNARGRTPIVRPEAVVHISPYTEKIVLSNNGNLRSESSSTLDIDGRPLNYSWNKTYELKTVPERRISYPVEELDTNEIRAMYDKTNDIIRYKTKTSITKKIADGVCPPGYDFDPKYQHCTDIDECSTETTCPEYNEICVNRLGSYTCECIDGYSRRSDNQLCERMEDNEVTGSKRSKKKDERLCEDGLKFFDGVCEDVNECVRTPAVCSREEVCLNLFSSYLCTPIPCGDDALINLNDSSCVLYCDKDRDCLEGAALTEAFSLVPVAVNEVNVTLEPHEEIAQMSLTFFNGDESLHTLITVTPENKELRLRAKLVGKKISLYTLEHLAIVDMERVNVHASLRKHKTLLKTHQYIVIIYNMNNLTEL